MNILQNNVVLQKHIFFVFNNRNKAKLDFEQNKCEQIITQLFCISLSAYQISFFQMFHTVKY